MKRAVLIITAILLNINVLMAQHTISGTLVDGATNEALAFVNVGLIRAADTVYVSGVASNDKGFFKLENVRNGQYILQITAIGYENYKNVLDVTEDVDLGVIKMNEGAVRLDEVVITEKKPLFANDGEKTLYNVSEDPSIQTGTASDALQNAPGVEVDVEGNITLRGVSSVEIWINDKPSKLTEENLKTYLQTLPANAIARIETITNPSAKYATDAEAVINIVTSTHIKSNQFVSFGVNGSNQPFISPWVSYMWKKEKLSINIFAAGRYSDRDNTSDEWQLSRRDAETPGEYEITWADTTKQASRNRNYSGNLFMNIDYEIDTSSNISVDAGGFYNHNDYKMTRLQRQTYYYLDSIPQYSELLIDTTRDKTTANSLFGHIGADYTKKFDNFGHNLRISVNSRISHNANEEWYNRFYDTYTDLNEHRYMLTDQNNYSISLDARYNRPYSRDGELSYGLRADHQNTDNVYNRYNDTLATVIDELRAYHFKGQESSINADVNWTHRWGGFTFSAGLGAGTDRSYYNYISEMPFADDSTLYYFTVRPSVHLTYRTQNMHNIKLNYTMRMSHPDESQVSSYRRYGENSYSTGNPNLKNGFTHNMEAGWQKFFNRFGNVGLEAYGRLSTNEISNLTDSEYDEYLDRVVSYTVPYNLGNSWRYGTSLNMTYRPTGFFNVRMYANLYNYGYHMEYNRDGVHQIDENEKWSWSVRGNAWMKFFNQYQFTVSAFYNSPTISLMSERKARYSLNMGVRSDFFNRKMSVYVNVQDIFNWGAKIGSGSSNTNPYYLTDNTNKMLNSRYISVGVTFRFGKMELERSAKEGSSESGDSLE